MSGKRERTNELKIFLSDDEKYVLDNKVKASGMRNKSEYIRHMILYNYTYDVNYDELREYNRQLSIIGKNINMIRERIFKTGNIYQNDVKEIKESNNTTKINASKVTTFLYHRVYDTNEKCTDIYICKKKSAFDTEMKYLKDNNYLTLKMEEMYLFLTNKIQIEKPVLLTFDDGYLWKNVIEVLEKYDLYGSGFIITGRFNDYSVYESENFELHSHTNNMHTAGYCKSGLQGGGILCKSEKDVLEDLNKSRDILKNPIALSYPFYDYNDRAIQLVKKAGFKMSFIGLGGKGGKTSVNGDLYKISRATIWDTTSFSKWKGYL